MRSIRTPLALLFLASTFFGCGLALGIDDYAPDCDETSCTRCTSPSECGAPTACAGWTCETGFCKRTSVSEMVPPQVAGDCKAVECDGMGGTITVNDDSDSPKAACQITSCLDGTPIFEPIAQGTPCEVGNAKLCDGKGNCVECMTDTDCGAIDLYCDSNTNTCFSCKDGIQSGNETDVDCGGGKCLYCTQGRKCLIDADCVAPNLCVDGICCNSACDAACKACDVPGSIGYCDFVPRYEEDPSFGNGQSCLNADNLSCNGGGGCGGTFGQPCAANGDCASAKCGDPDGDGTKTCVKDLGDPCNLPTECYSYTCTNGICG